MAHVRRDWLKTADGSYLNITHVDQFIVDAVVRGPEEIVFGIFAQIRGGQVQITDEGELDPDGGQMQRELDKLMRWIGAA